MELPNFLETCEIWSQELILDPIITSEDKAYKISPLYYDKERYTRIHSVELKDKFQVRNGKVHEKFSRYMYFGNIIM